MPSPTTNLLPSRGKFIPDVRFAGGLKAKDHTRSTRVLFFSLLLLVSLARGLCAADVFATATLRQYAATDPLKIFEDPTIACYLKALLGAKKLKELQENMPIMEADEPDGSGAFPFCGEVRGLGGYVAGIVLIHPDGRLWVGSVGAGPLEYFTNSKSSLRAPPATITAWAKDAHYDTWHTVSSAKDDVAGQVKHACAAEKLRDERKKFEAREKGELCDERRHFSSYDVAKVIADASHRAYFRNSKSYLVADDLVELASQQREDADAVCVRYRRDATHEVVGWLPKKHVQPIDGAVIQERANTTIDIKAWIGEWEREHAELRIEALAENQLTVNGNAGEGTYIGEINNAAYTVMGASAVSSKLGTPDAEPCDEIGLYLFNNALYAIGDGMGCPSMR